MNIQHRDDILYVQLVINQSAEVSLFSGGLGNAS
jgi:hypothetical protein